MSKFRRTMSGENPLTVISLLQKAIRRNRPDLAGWAANEMLRSGYANWCWRRLCVTAAEDCAVFVQTEVNSLRAACDRERKERRGPPTRVFAMKAVLVLCSALKSRDADHLSNLIVDAGRVSLTEIRALIDQIERDGVPETPDWALDVHTSEGRRAGRTKRDFYKAEQRALSPAVPGLFDDLPWHD